VGWYIEDYQTAQISINFTDYKTTPIHAVFDEVCVQAAEIGLRVTGSELVGLIPKDALLTAGRHYLIRQGKCPGVPETELIRTAVRSLGLADVAPFDPKKKIIEYQFEEPAKALVGMTLRGFTDELSMESPAPGGGSVAALCGALSAGLSSMVANLTVGKKGYERFNGAMSAAAMRAQELKDEYLALVDRDTDAFNKVMDAFRLPKAAEDQAREREAAIEAATKDATLVPLRTLAAALELLDLAGLAARDGNRNSLSDAGVAALAARTAAEGAYYNVRINLPGIKDADFKARIAEQAASLRRQVLRAAAAIARRVEREFEKP
jgi:glutamate formiminotransferase/formiminotetrahydrofolate cyclodeaminase